MFIQLLISLTKSVNFHKPFKSTQIIHKYNKLN
nr:MAG TPA: hypothetical protein [Bacteriophage sp.]